MLSYSDDQSIKGLEQCASQQQPAKDQPPAKHQQKSSEQQAATDEQHLKQRKQRSTSRQKCASKQFRASHNSARCANPPALSYVDDGNMNVQCRFCSALFWPGDNLGKSKCSSFPLQRQYFNFDDLLLCLAVLFPPAKHNDPTTPLSRERVPSTSVSSTGSVGVHMSYMDNGYMALVGGWPSKRQRHCTSFCVINTVCSYVFSYANIQTKLFD